MRCHNDAVAKGLIGLRSTVRQVLLPSIGVLHVIVVALLPLRSTPEAFTHASMSTVATLADLAAGVGLLLAGLIWTRARRRSPVGPLAICASIVWFAPDWIGWDGGPALARSVALLAAPLFGPIVLHLVVVSVGGLRRWSTLLIVVVAAYAAITLLSVARALVRDPLLDLQCLEPPRNCDANVFLLIPDQRLANILEPAMLGILGMLGVLMVVIGCSRLVMATMPARRAHWPLLAAGVAVGSAEAVASVASLAGRDQIAIDPTLDPLFLWRAAAAAGLALALAWKVARDARIGAAIARLVGDIGAGSHPGGLQSALAASLGDPGLTVAYRLPATDRYVDPDGHAIDPTPRSGRVATPISRGGHTIALVVHDAGLVDSGELAATIGSAARLAVDNDRLQAEVRARVRDLTQSRARIVETADRTRQGLERNLHDGAQQRLLALSYELRLGRAAAVKEGRPDLAALFDQAIAENQTVLDELRDLAHGIFPVVLAEAGLGPAFADLADRSTVSFEVHGDLDNRCPPAGEAAAYVIVAEVIRSARDRGATFVRLDVGRAHGRITLRITGDGSAPPGSSAPLADRAGAAGGSLVDETDGVGLDLRLEVPCA